MIPHYAFLNVPRAGLEPAQPSLAKGFKSLVSTNSTIAASYLA